MAYFPKRADNRISGVPASSFMSETEVKELNETVAGGFLSVAEMKKNKQERQEEEEEKMNSKPVELITVKLSPEKKGLDLKILNSANEKRIRCFLEYSDQEKLLEEQIDLFTRLVAMVSLHIKPLLNKEMVIGYWDDEKDFITLGSWPELVHAITLMGDKPFKVMVYANNKDRPKWTWAGNFSPNKFSRFSTILHYHKTGIRIAPAREPKCDSLVGCEILITKRIPTAIQGLVPELVAAVTDPKLLPEGCVSERIYKPHLYIKKKYTTLEEEEMEKELEEDSNFVIVHNGKDISQVLYDCDMPEFAPELTKDSVMAHRVGSHRFCHHDTGALKDDVLGFYEQPSHLMLLLHCHNKILVLPKNRIGLLHFKSTLDVGCFTWNVFPNVTKLAAFARHLTAKPTFMIVCLAHGRVYLRYFPVGCFAVCNFITSDLDWSDHGIVSFYQLPEEWHRLEEKYGEGNVRLGFNGSKDPVFYLGLEVREIKNAKEEEDEEEEEEEESSEDESSEEEEEEELELELKEDDEYDVFIHDGEVPHSNRKCTLNCKELGGGRLWHAIKIKEYRVDIITNTEIMMISLEVPFLLLNTTNGKNENFLTMNKLYDGIKKQNAKHDLVVFFFCTGVQNHYNFIATGFGPRWGKNTTQPNVLIEKNPDWFNFNSNRWSNLFAGKLEELIHHKVGFRLNPKEHVVSTCFVRNKLPDSLKGKEEEEEEKKERGIYCDTEALRSEILKDIKITEMGARFRCTQSCYGYKYRLPKNFIGILHLNDTDDWYWRVYPKIKQAKVYMKSLLTDTDQVYLIVHCGGGDNGNLFIRNFGTPSDDQYKWTTQPMGVCHYTLVDSWKDFEKKFGKGNVRFDFASKDCEGYNNYSLDVKTWKELETEESQSNTMKKKIPPSPMSYLTSAHNSSCSLNCKVFGCGDSWEIQKPYYADDTNLSPEQIKNLQTIRILFVGEHDHTDLTEDFPFLLVHLNETGRCANYANYNSIENIWTDMSQKIETESDRFLLFFYCCGTTTKDGGLMRPISKHDNFIVTGFGPEWSRTTSQTTISICQNPHATQITGTNCGMLVDQFIQRETGFRLMPEHFEAGIWLSLHGSTDKPKTKEDAEQIEKNKQKEACTKWWCSEGITYRTWHCTRKCQICHKHVYQRRTYECLAKTAKREINAGDKLALDKRNKQVGFTFSFGGGYVHEHCLVKKYKKYKKEKKQKWKLTPEEFLDKLKKEEEQVMITSLLRKAMGVEETTVEEIGDKKKEKEKEDHDQCNQRIREMEKSDKPSGIMNLYKDDHFIHHYYDKMKE